MVRKACLKGRLVTEDRTATTLVNIFEFVTPIEPDKRWYAIVWLILESFCDRSSVILFLVAREFWVEIGTFFNYGGIQVA